MSDSHNLALNPIKFVNIEYPHTILSENWVKTHYFLSQLSTQNILYSTFHEAKNITEISKSLNIPADFVADEIHYLETNGFLDKTNRDKYLSNILIHDLSKEILEERHKILNRYAKIVLEKYVPILLDQLSTINYQLSTVNCQWTLLSFALNYKITFPEISKNLKKHYSKKLDGSEYLVSVILDKDFDLNYNPYKYKYLLYYKTNYTPRDIYPIKTYVYSTYYDNRNDDWVIYIENRFTRLYDFYRRRLQIDKYNQIKENFTDIKSGNFLESGLLIYPENDQPPFINLLISPIKKEDLLASLPNMPPDFTTLNHNLASELYNLTKSQYPDRMQEILYDFTRNSLASGEIFTRVIEQALHYNILLPLSDIEKKTVNMIMFLE